MIWLIGFSAYLAAVGLVVFWWAFLPRGDSALLAELRDLVELEERIDRRRDLARLS